MAIEQISVFLENNAGRLCEVTETLSKAGVNLRAISIADTADFGILRIIVNKHEAAVKTLSDAGFTVRLTSVVAIEIDDAAGSLNKIMEQLRSAGINIEYLYSSHEHSAGKAVIVFKLDKQDEGKKVLEKQGVKFIDGF